MAIIEIYDTTFSATTVLRALAFDRVSAERLARDCTIHSIFQDSSGLFLSKMTWKGSTIRIQFRVRELADRTYRILASCSCGAARCLHAEVVLLALRNRETGSGLQRAYQETPVGRDGHVILSSSSIEFINALRDSSAEPQPTTPLRSPSGCARRGVRLARK